MEGRETIVEWPVVGLPMEGRETIVEWKRIRRCTTSSSSRSRSREESAAVVVLPMDIIEDEILWRLPVKSLLRCKSVCKLWYSIIKNPKPKLIKTHYNHQNNITRPLFFQKYRHLKRFPIVFNPSVKTAYSVWPIRRVVKHNDNNNNINASSLFSYYLGLPFPGMFVRPVNGVSLIVLPDYAVYRCRMAMFNPATRQFRKLPRDDFEINQVNAPSVRHKLHSFYVHHIFGLGICSNHHHHLVYKVVWLNRLASQMDVAVAKVYTVDMEGGGGGGEGDRDWRIINAALPGDYVGNYSNDPSYGVSLNGKYYWLSEDLAHILVFDFDEELFREMNSPLLGEYLQHYSEKVCSNENVMCSEMRCPGKEEHDSLALFLFETEFVHISVMDNEEEWHWIQHKVSYIDHRPVRDLFNLNPLRLQFQQVLQSPITEAILLNCGDFGFALYSPKTYRCVVFVGGESIHSKVSVFNFKESLFSIDGAVQVSDRVLEDFYTFI